MSIKEYLEITRKQIVIRAAEESLKEKRLLEELIDLAGKDEQPYSWRSAWALATAATIDASKIQPYIKEILSKIRGVKEGTQIAQLLKTLSLLNLEESKDMLGDLLDYCFDAVENPNLKAAARVYAIEVLLKISLFELELRSELKEFIEYMQPLFEEPSTQSKARNTLKQLKRLSKQ